MTAPPQDRWLYVEKAVWVAGAMTFPKVFVCGACGRERSSFAVPHDPRVCYATHVEKKYL
jgi:hypothetical protein